METLQQEKSKRIKTPLGKPGEYRRPMPLPFGSIENIDGYDFWEYRLEDLEAACPQFKTLLAKQRDLHLQRLTEMHDEVLALLEKPFREDKLTLELIQGLQDHVMSTWKISEIEDYYRFSVALRFSDDNPFLFPLVDTLFADFSAMAALVGGALLYSGIVHEQKPNEHQVMGGKIDAYRSIFGDMTYKDALALLPDEKSELFQKIVCQIFGERLQGMLAEFSKGQERIHDAVQATKRAVEKTNDVAEKVLHVAQGNSNKSDILVGRTGDNEVSARELSKILCAELSKVGNHKGITARTVQNWDMYLKSGGGKGTHPPEGYTLDTRRTWEAARAFAITYAHRENACLKKHVAYNDIHHFRNNTD